MITNARKDGEKEDCARIILNALEKEYEEAFFSVCMDLGYTTQRTPQICANFWVAMCEEANLRVLQQRIINKYLSIHFGQRICVKETDITEIGSNFIQYQSEQKKIDGKKIIYHYQNLT